MVIQSHDETHLPELFAGAALGFFLVTSLLMRWKRGDMNGPCFQVQPVGNQNFCDKGDSGAALLTDKNLLVGILQAEAATPAGLLGGIGIRIDYVFERLNAMITEREDAKYPIEQYPNMQFVAQLFFR
jgi:hypothetical protein